MVASAAQNVDIVNVIKGVRDANNSRFNHKHINIIYNIMCNVRITLTRRW